MLFFILIIAQFIDFFKLLCYTKNKKTIFIFINILVKEGNLMGEIVDLINTQGFPIAVCLIMFFFFNMRLSLYDAISFSFNGSPDVHTINAGFFVKSFGKRLQNLRTMDGALNACTG